MSLFDNADEIRQEILTLVEKFAKIEFPEKQFVPGQTPVPVSGRVFDGILFEMA